jgi:peptidoglycan hydrolase-like protein with peptidoglycan-binding domain
MGLVLFAAFGGLMYWAGTNAVAPPSLPGSDQPVPTYAAQDGTVGQSDDVSVTASWASAQTVLSNASGVVTSVRQQPGQLASSGDVIATVNLQPVVVVAGSVPTFRTLTKDETGPDVAQWQTLLIARGLLSGVASGKFDAATAAATRAFRKSIGASDAASVGPETVVFVATMPARLVLLVGAGDRVSEGSSFLRVLAAKPDFVALIPASERLDLASGMPVTIDRPGSGSWTGVLGTLDPQQDGSYSASITGSLCGDDCGLIAPQGGTALGGHIELVPKTSGVLVPTSALVQQASGGLYVMLADGTSLPVTIVAEADGFAVVKGLEAGTVVQLPGAPSQ